LSDSVEIPLTNLREEALRLMDSAKKQNITLRLFGGMAVHLRCPSSTKPGLKRSYGDLDFITEWSNLGDIEPFFHRSGYTADRVMNTLNGDRRQLYFDEVNHRQVDILVDEFEMCHQIPLTKRLKTDELTLPLCELLLTKVQIIEMNPKDVLDVFAILLDHEFGSGDGERVNKQILENLCGDDWGLYTTVTENLMMILDRLETENLDIPSGNLGLLKIRMNDFLQVVTNCPKSARWKMRSIVGKRIPWYEEVEEVRR
jgi:hypothetical protein